MIERFLEEHKYLLTDGAMGTYYYEVTKSPDSMSEWANIHNPNIIKQIHNQYKEAGAKLLRTNTFSANTKVMGTRREQLREILIKGYRICEEVAGEDNVFVAADIGPIPEDEDNYLEVLDEYKFIVDTFLECEANLFLFETFSSTKYIKEITEYIKNKNKEAFIITQYAVDSTGHTRQGIPVSKLMESVRDIETVDAYGLNCGVGPTHMYKIFNQLQIGDDIVTALPNAGYPYVENERTIYPGNPIYFSKVVRDIQSTGAKIIGGCCGTTPEHIRQLSQALLKVNPVQKEAIKVYKKQKSVGNDLDITPLIEKLNKGEKVIMVELDPPYSTDITKIMEGAKKLKESGVHVITIADSPLGRARVDSVVVAAKIKRELEIDVMPHICCRDNNIIGLKSKILGLHVEEIRQVLAVTGDPVPSANRGEIKGVFNLNAIKLMELIKVMNEELFNVEKLYYGGALNLNATNMESTIKRMEKKLEAGATFFLTQPIYDDRAIQRLKEIKDEYKIKIIAGIMPIVSLRNALYLNNEVPGIHIPDEYIQQFNEEMTREEAENTGINIATNLIQKLQIADGLYLMTPFNRVNMISRIISKVGVG